MEFLIERSGGFEWFSGERSIGEEVGFIEDFPRIWIRFCRSVEVCGSCIVNLLAKEDFSGAEEDGPFVQSCLTGRGSCWKQEEEKLLASIGGEVCGKVVFALI